MIKYLINNINNLVFNIYNIAWLFDILLSILLFSNKKMILLLFNLYFDKTALISYNL